MDPVQKDWSIECTFLSSYAKFRVCADGAEAVIEGNI